MRKDYLYLAVIGVLSFVIYRQKKKEQFIIDECFNAIDLCNQQNSTITFNNKNL
tara:strand:+ start:315 stop:476 length:162 start_codon:yes stop_codon:yes gene_type:complete